MQLYTGNGTPAEPKETMTDPCPLPIRKYVGSGGDCCLNYAELNNLTLEEEECTS